MVITIRWLIILVVALLVLPIGLAASITVNWPLNNSWVNSSTHYLNVSFDRPVYKAWFSVDDLVNTTLCFNCSNVTFNFTIPVNDVNDPSLVLWLDFENDSTYKIYDKSMYHHTGEIVNGDTRLLLHMDEGSGSTVYDSSSYGNNGTIYGASWSSDCVSGKCLQFDGIDDYAEIENSDSLKLINQLTICAWFKFRPDTTQTYDPIVAKPDEGRVGYGLLINKITNKLTFYLNTTVSYGSEDGPSISPNVWYFACGVWNGSAAAIYLNGIETYSRTHTGTLDLDSSPLYIGKWNDRYFNGTIDEVAIYSRALTGEEIKELYLAKKAKFGEFTDSEIGKGFRGQGEKYGPKVKMGHIDGISSKVTLEAWVYPRSFDEPYFHYPKIISYGAYSANSGAELTARSSGFHFSIQDVSGYKIGIGSGELLPNRWYHVIGTYDNCYLKLFVNGVLKSSRKICGLNVTPSSSEYLWVGAMVFSDGRRFNGTISEIRVYNRSLSEEEALQHYYSKYGLHKLTVYTIDNATSQLTTKTIYFYTEAVKPLFTPNYPKENSETNSFPVINFTLTERNPNATKVSIDDSPNITITYANDTIDYLYGKPIFADDFSLPYIDLTKWNYTSGNWQIENNKLKQGSVTSNYSILTKQNFTNGIISFDFETNGTIALLFRYQNSTNFYRLIFNTSSKEVWLENSTSKISYIYTFEPEEKTRVLLYLKDFQLKLWVNNEYIFTFNNLQTSEGKLGSQTIQSKAFFDDFAVGEELTDGDHTLKVYSIDDYGNENYMEIHFTSNSSWVIEPEFVKSFVTRITDLKDTARIIYKPTFTETGLLTNFFATIKIGNNYLMNQTGYAIFDGNSFEYTSGNSLSDNLIEFFYNSTKGWKQAKFFIPANYIRKHNIYIWKEAEDLNYQGQVCFDNSWGSANPSGTAAIVVGDGDASTNCRLDATGNATFWVYNLPAGRYNLWIRGNAYLIPFLISISTNNKTWDYFNYELSNLYTTSWDQLKWDNITIEIKEGYPLKIMLNDTSADAWKRLAFDALLLTTDFNYNPNNGDNTYGKPLPGHFKVSFTSLGNGVFEVKVFGNSNSAVIGYINDSATSDALQVKDNLVKVYQFYDKQLNFEYMPLARELQAKSYSLLVNFTLPGFDNYYTVWDNVSVRKLNATFALVDESNTFDDELNPEENYRIGAKIYECDDLTCVEVDRGNFSIEVNGTEYPLSYDVNSQYWVSPVIGKTPDAIGNYSLSLNFSGYSFPDNIQAKWIDRQITYKVKSFSFEFFLDKINYNPGESVYINGESTTSAYAFVPYLYEESKKVSITNPRELILTNYLFDLILNESYSEPSYMWYNFKGIDNETVCSGANCLNGYSERKYALDLLKDPNLQMLLEFEKNSSTSVKESSIYHRPNYKKGCSFGSEKIDFGRTAGRGYGCTKFSNNTPSGKGYALDLTPECGQVKVAGDDSWYFENGITVDFDLSLQGKPENGFSLIDSTYINPIHIWVSSNSKIAFELHNSSAYSQIYYSISDRDIGKWHHFTLTAKPFGKMRLYVDGKLYQEVDSINYSWEIPGYKELYLNPGSADTLIDNLKIYNRQLSEEEVKQNYLGNYSKYGLVLFLPFDEGSGDWFEDYSYKEKDFGKYLKTNGETDYQYTNITVYGYPGLTIAYWINVSYPQPYKWWGKTHTMGDCWTCGYPNTGIYLVPEESWLYSFGIGSGTACEGGSTVSGYGYYLPSNEWIFIVITYSARERMVRIYVNGKLWNYWQVPEDKKWLTEFNPDSAVHPDYYKRFVIGSNVYFGENVKMSTDFVLILNRSLTPEEVQTLYETQTYKKFFASSIYAYVNNTEGFSSFTWKPIYVDLRKQSINTIEYNYDDLISQNLLNVTPETVWHYLYLPLEYSTGEIQSNLTFQTDFPIIAIKPIINAYVPSNAELKLYLSVDNGVTWKEVPNNTLTAFTYNFSNNKLKFKVVFENNGNTERIKLYSITFKVLSGLFFDNDKLAFSFPAPNYPGNYTLEILAKTSKGIKAINKTYVWVKADTLLNSWLSYNKKININQMNSIKIFADWRRAWDNQQVDYSNAELKISIWNSSSALIVSNASMQYNATLGAWEYNFSLPYADNFTYTIYAGTSLKENGVPYENKTITKQFKVWNYTIPIQINLSKNVYIENEPIDLSGYAKFVNLKENYTLNYSNASFYLILQKSFKPEIGLHLTDPNYIATNSPLIEVKGYTDYNSSLIEVCLDGNCEVTCTYCNNFVKNYTLDEGWHYLRVCSGAVESDAINNCTERIFAVKPNKNWIKTLVHDYSDWQLQNLTVAGNKLVVENGSIDVSFANATLINASLGTKEWKLMMISNDKMNEVFGSLVLNSSEIYYWDSSANAWLPLSYLASKKEWSYYKEGNDSLVNYSIASAVHIGIKDENPLGSYWLNREGKTYSERGLVLYLPFDEGSGTQATDLSNYNNHGTIYGASWTKGVVGNALSFDGVDDYVEVPDSPELRFGNNDFSIEMWIYSEFDTLRTVFAYKDVVNTGYFLIAVDEEGKIWVRTRSSDTNEVLWFSSKPMKPGWNHVVFVRTWNKWYWYTNSDVKTTNDTRTGREFTFAGYYIGHYREGGYGWFKGIIDEVRIYNRALTEEEIKQHYQEGLKKIHTYTPLSLNNGKIKVRSDFYSYLDVLNESDSKLWSLDFGDFKLNNQSLLSIYSVKNYSVYFFDWRDNKWKIWQKGVSNATHGYPDFDNPLFKQAFKWRVRFYRENYPEINFTFVLLANDEFLRVLVNTSCKNCSENYTLYMPAEPGIEEKHLGLYSDLSLKVAGGGFPNWNQKNSKYGANPWLLLTNHGDIDVGTISVVNNDNGNASLHPSYKYYDTSIYGHLPHAGAWWIKSRCNWQVDIPNHKYFFEFYLDNDLKYVNSTIIWRDNVTTDWQVSKGSGNLYNSSDNINGTNSLLLNCTSDSNGLLAVTYNPSGTWDFSHKEFIAFYVKLNDTAQKVFINLTDDLGNWSYWERDTWVNQSQDINNSWVRWVLPLKAPTTNSTYPADLTRIDKIEVGVKASGNTAYKLWVDDIVIDNGQWVQVESFVPDRLADSDNDGLVEVNLYSWDGSSWQLPCKWDDGSIADCDNPALYTLSGITFDYIYGTPGYSFTNGFGFYPPGERGETKQLLLSDSLLPDTPSSITYSSYYGVKNRIGFAIKLPPDDGQDNSTYGISQVKLKLEVYYDPGDQGRATYEFSSDDNKYWGLKNMLLPYLLLYNYQTSDHPLVLTTINKTQADVPLFVTANENQTITEVGFNLDLNRTNSFLFALGDLGEKDTKTDSDDNEVPDIFESDDLIEKAVTSLNWYEPVEYYKQESSLNNEKIFEKGYELRYVNNAEKFFNLQDGENSLVLNLPFDEGSGNIAYDHSDYGNNGTIYGAKWIDGKFGKALSFDGVDDYVCIPRSSSLEPSQLTVAVWVKMNSLISTDWGPMLVSKYGGNWKGYTLYLVGNTGRSTFDIRTPSVAYIATSPEAISTDEWYFIVGTWDGSKIRIYVNGVLKDIADAPTITHSSDLCIGKNSWVNAGYVNGTIDEVRIYNKALSEEEIKALYYATKWRYEEKKLTKKLSTVFNPVLYLPFDEGSGKITYDYSGNDNDGAIHGAKWVDGKYGKALEFDGVDDYVDISHSWSYHASDLPSSTWIVWFKINSLPPPGYHYKVVGSSGHDMSVFVSSDGRVGFRHQSNIYLYGDEIQVSKWVFFAASVKYLSENSIEYTLFINGKLYTGTKTSDNLNISECYSGYHIGNDNIWRGVYFNGTIDEVRIYNRALTPEEIKLLYLSGAYRKGLITQKEFLSQLQKLTSTTTHPIPQKIYLNYSSSLNSLLLNSSSVFEKQLNLTQPKNFTSIKISPIFYTQTKLAEINNYTTFANNFSALEANYALGNSTPEVIGVVNLTKDQFSSAMQTTSGFLNYSANDNLPTDQGLLNFWIKPFDTITKNCYFYSQNFSICYESNYLIYKHGNCKIKYKPLIPNTWHQITASWNKTGKYIMLFVDNELKGIAYNCELPSNYSYFLLGSDDKANLADALIDELTIENKTYDLQELKVFVKASNNATELEQLNYTECNPFDCKLNLSGKYVKIKLEGYSSLQKPIIVKSIKLITDEPKSSGLAIYKGKLQGKILNYSILGKISNITFTNTGYSIELKPGDCLEALNLTLQRESSKTLQDGTFYYLLPGLKRGSYTLTALVTDNSSYNYTSMPLAIYEPMRIDYSYAFNKSGEITQLILKVWTTGRYSAKPVNASINVTIGGITKNCTSTACVFNFTFGPSAELRGGDYLIKINAIPIDPLYLNKSKVFELEVEEPKTQPEIIIPDKIIKNYIAGQTYSFLLNTTFIAKHGSASDIDFTPTSWHEKILNVTKYADNCSSLSLGESCTETFNVTLADSCVVSDPPYPIEWNVTWKNPDGTSDYQQLESTVDLQAYINLLLNLTQINLTANLSSPHTYRVNVTSQANIEGYNLSFTSPYDWITFSNIQSPASAQWIDEINGWNIIYAGDYGIAQINVSLNNFTPAVYTKPINVSVKDSEGNLQDLKQIDLFINVSPQLTVSDQYFEVYHNQTNYLYVPVNSTGNAKLVDVQVTYQEQTLPTSWLTIQPNLGDIIEGNYKLLNINATIPELQDPGNYTGKLIFDTANGLHKEVLLTLYVKKDLRWDHEPKENITKEFPLNTPGVLGAVTVYNLGNTPMNFTINYIKSGIGDTDCSEINCLEENYQGYNPTWLYVDKNSSASFQLYVNGYSTPKQNVGFAINISYPNATPTYSIVYVLYNITDKPPYYTILRTEVSGDPWPKVELNHTITLHAQVKDDSQVNVSSFYFNVTRPDGSTQHFTIENISYSCVGANKICDFYLQYQGANTTGTYNYKAYVEDNAQHTNISSNSFEVVNHTVLHLQVLQRQTATLITQDTGQNISLQLNISNLGYSTAYNTSVHAQDLPEGWFSYVTFLGDIQPQSYKIAQVIIYVPRATLPNTYPLTINLTWHDYSGNLYNETTQDSATVAANYSYKLIELYTKPITVEHGNYSLVTFKLNLTGNTNETNWYIQAVNLDQNLSVSFNQTFIQKLVPMQPAPIQMNVSVDKGAESKIRYFDLQISSQHNPQKLYQQSVYTPSQPEWKADRNATTVNAVSDQPDQQVIAIINNTGNTPLTFQLSLTGNLTAYANLLESSFTLQPLESKAVKLNYTFPAGADYYQGTLTIKDTTINQVKNISININVVNAYLVLTYANPTYDVEVGQPINLHYYVVYKNENVTENQTQKVYIGSKEASITSKQVQGNETWLTVEAPNLPDGKSYDLLISVDYQTPDLGLLTIKGKYKDKIHYKDVSPPVVVSLQTQTPIQKGSDEQIQANVTDNVAVDTVLAKVYYPNNTLVDTFAMQKSVLYTTTVPAEDLTEIGKYTVRIYANDTSGNENYATSGYFEVFEYKEYKGCLQTTSGEPIQASFKLYNPETETLEYSFATNESGCYDVTIKTKSYELVLDVFGHTFVFDSVNFAELNSSFIKIDYLSKSMLNDLPASTEGLKGVAICLQSDSTGNVTMRYIEDDLNLCAGGCTEADLKVYECEDWNYTEAICTSPWFDKTSQQTNVIKNEVYGNSFGQPLISSCSAYAILEYKAEEIPEMEVPQTEFYTTIYPNTTGSVSVKVDSVGSAPLENIHMTCLSGKACEDFEFYAPVISKLPSGSIDIPVNFTVPAYYPPGTYDANVRIESNQYPYKQTKDILIHVIVPEVANWTAENHLHNISTGGLNQGYLGYILLKNTGNINVTINISQVSGTNLVPDYPQVIIKPNETRKVNIEYYAPKDYGEHLLYLTASSQQKSIVFPVLINVTYAVNILNVTPTKDIGFNQLLTVNASAIYEGIEQTSNMEWKVYIGNTECQNATWSYNGVWIINCLAPNLTSKLTYTLKLEGTFLLYQQQAYDIAYDIYNIKYKDLFPPKLENHTKEHEKVDQPIEVNASFYEPSGLKQAKVYVYNPSGKLEGLYTVIPENNTVTFSHIFQKIGDYLLVYEVEDNKNNTGNQTAYFEVFEYLPQFKGQVNNPEGVGRKVNFKFYRPKQNYASDQLLDEISTDEQGKYLVISRLHKRAYDIEVDVGNEYVIRANNVNLTEHYQDPIDLDIIPTYKISIPGFKDFKAIAVKLNGFETDGEVMITYDETQVDNIANLYILRCDNWDFENETCEGNWTILNTTRIAEKVSAKTNKLCAFVLAEAAASIQPGATIYNYTYKYTYTTATGGGGGGVTTGLEKRIKALEQLVAQLLNRTEEETLEAKTSSISVEIYPGESTRSEIYLRNTYNHTVTVTLQPEGDAAPYIYIDTPSTEIPSGKLARINVKIFANPQAIPGLYLGDILVKSKEKTLRIPVDVRIMERREKLLDLKVQPLTNEISPGQVLKASVKIYNLGMSKRVDVLLSLALVDPKTEEIITAMNDTLAVETSTEVIEKLKIPEDLKYGKYVLEAIGTYQSAENVTMKATSLAYINVVEPFLKRKLFGVPIFIYLLVVGSFAAGVSAFKYYSNLQQKKRRYKEEVDLHTLPQPSERAGFIGKVTQYGVRAFYNLDDLTTHAIVAGSTGSGKTFTAQVLVEEALKHKVAVIVFDPTAQWTGFLKRASEKRVLKFYPQFGMKKSEARGFPGRIKIIENPREKINIKDYMNPGEITIFCLHKLDPKDIDIVVASTIQQVFKANLEESPNLRLLIVYDEVHRLLPKFGGSGAGFIQLERGVREFRKWGVGLLLISQVMSDFIGAIRANIGTEIQMRTRDEGDLERLRMKYGEDIMRSIVKADVGTGLMQNPKYNKGRPYFVTFRPILHSVTRLTDEELETYVKYDERIELLKYLLKELKKKGVETFDMELELKLAENKLKSGSFRMVEIYLETLEPKIKKEAEAHRIEAKRREKELISEEEIKASVEEAKKLREEYLKKEKEKIAKAQETTIGLESPKSREVTVQKPNKEEVAAEEHSKATDLNVEKEEQVESTELSIEQLDEKISALLKKIDELEKKGEFVALLKARTKSLKGDISMVKLTNEKNRLEKIKQEIAELEKEINSLVAKSDKKNLTA